MNRIFTFLMITALSATIFSCGDDKEEVKPVETLTPYEEAVANLIGNTWHLVKVHTSETESVEMDDCNSQTDIFYRENGVLEFIVADICEGKEDSKGIWKLSEDMSILYRGDSEANLLEYKVIELTSEKKVIEMPDTGSNVNAGWHYEYISE